MFDVFAAHWVARLKELLTEVNNLFVYVPASCTSELQPLDKSISNPYKELKQCFIDWYASEVNKVLDKGEEVNISLQTSIIKEVHANWIIKTLSEIEKRKDMVILGLRTGILECIH